MRGQGGLFIRFYTFNQRRLDFCPFFVRSGVPNNRNRCTLMSIGRLLTTILSFPSCFSSSSSSFSISYQPLSTYPCRVAKNGCIVPSRPFTACYFFSAKIFNQFISREFSSPAHTTWHIIASAHRVNGKKGQFRTVPPRLPLPTHCCEMREK